MPYELNPRHTTWSSDGAPFTIVVEPLGSSFLQAAIKKVNADFADSEPQVPMERLDDGTEEVVYTTAYKEKKQAWDRDVDLETHRRLDSIIVSACVKGVVSGEPSALEEVDWKKIAKAYRKENAALSAITDFPEDDLELFIRFIALKARSQIDSFTNLCFHGESVADRVKSFPDK